MNDAAELQLHAAQGSRMGQLEDQLVDLTIRMEAAYARIDSLEQALGSMKQQLAQQQTPTSPSHESRGTRPLTETQGRPHDLDSGIQNVLNLVLTGNVEEAQRLLLSLPKAEMERQPSIVALTAATLCIKRGELQGGLTALQRARQFTDDARLLKVIEKLEAQISSH